MFGLDRDPTGRKTLAATHPGLRPSLWHWGPLGPFGASEPRWRLRL